MMRWAFLYYTSTHNKVTLDIELMIGVMVEWPVSRSTSADERRRRPTVCSKIWKKKMPKNPIFFVKSISIILIDFTKKMGFFCNFFIILSWLWDDGQQPTCMAQERAKQKPFPTRLTSKRCVVYSTYLYYLNDIV